MAERVFTMREQIAIRRTVHRWSWIVDNPDEIPEKDCALCVLCGLRYCDDGSMECASCGICPVTAVFGYPCTEGDGTHGEDGDPADWCAEWVLMSALLLAEVAGVRL